MEIKLRDYQQDALDAISEAYFTKGITRQLCVLSTGAGKTVLSGFIPKALKPKKVLFLAHREELIDQTVETYKKIFPDSIAIGKEIGKHYASPEDDIIVGSVPTLGRLGLKRLEALFPDPIHTLVITDEAHHAAAASYKRIYEHFNLMSPSTRNMHVGITATPFRGDGETLADIFEEITYMRKLGDMILDGWLVDIKAKYINTDVSLVGVKKSRGDYVASDLSEAINTWDRNLKIVQAVKETTPDARTICFCADVQHAKDLAAMFKSLDFTAAVISGETPKDERRQLIEQFNSGKIQVLTNCAVLVEGFDSPAIETVVMARPTNSPVFYAQAIGRGMRLAEGKSFMTLIDIYDRANDAPIHLDQILNVPSNKYTYKEWKEVKKDLEDFMPIAAPDVLDNILDIDPKENIQYQLSKVDIFSVLTKLYESGVDTFVKSKSKLSWSRLNDNSYSIRGSGIGQIAIRENAIGKWELWHKAPRKEWLRMYEGTAPECFKEGDKIIEDAKKSALYLEAAAWKKKPPSEKQLDLIKRLSNGRLPKRINTRGEAMYILEGLFQLKK